MKKFCMAVGMWALALPGSQAVSAAEAAVYVDVETEKGTFTIEMDAGAKYGGAAFLGLAEGWVDWVDPRNGQPREDARYYEGTAMSLVQKDESGDTVVLGNYGRVFNDVDGNRVWSNGTGGEMPDDVSGPTGLVARSVAMVQEDGPHTLNGRWAVLLKDADLWFGGRWSRIGTVVSNWGVVESIASGERDGAGVLLEPVEVTGMRIRGDEGEIADWRAVAEASTPVCLPGEAGLEMNGDNGVLRCRIAGKGPFAVAHTTNLTDRIWYVDWMGRNEGDGALVTELPFSATEAGMGLRQAFAVTAVEYPELGGPTVTGRYAFRVEWEMGPGEENQVYQYDLDVGANTGMVWQLDLATQSQVLRSATLDQIIVRQGGAHSTLVTFVISSWLQVPYYWLGETEEGAGRGRYRMWEWMTGGEVWGDWMGGAVP